MQDKAPQAVQDEVPQTSQAEAPQTSQVEAANSEAEAQPAVQDEPQVVSEPVATTDEDDVEEVPAASESGQVEDPAGASSGEAQTASPQEEGAQGELEAVEGELSNGAGLSDDVEPADVPSGESAVDATTASLGASSENAAAKTADEAVAAVDVRQSAERKAGTQGKQGASGSEAQTLSAQAARAAQPRTSEVQVKKFIWQGNMRYVGKMIGEVFGISPDEVVFRLEGTTEDGEAFVREGSLDEYYNVLFTDVPFGDYTVTEVACPSGLRSITRSIAFTLTTAVDSIGWADTRLEYEKHTDNGGLSIVFMNDVVDSGGSLLVHKVDGDTGDALADATFDLVNENGIVVANGSTDAEGNLQFSDLTDGVYKLRESAAPEGYEGDDERIIVVSGGKTYVPSTEEPVDLTILASGENLASPENPYLGVNTIVNFAGLDAGEKYPITVMDWNTGEDTGEVLGYLTADEDGNASIEGVYDTFKDTGLLPYMTSAQTSTIAPIIVHGLPFGASYQLVSPAGNYRTDLLFDYLIDAYGLASVDYNLKDRSSEKAYAPHMLYSDAFVWTGCNAQAEWSHLEKGATLYAQELLEAINALLLKQYKIAPDESAAVDRVSVSNWLIPEEEDDPVEPEDNDDSDDADDADDADDSDDPEDADDPDDADDSDDADDADDPDNAVDPSDADDPDADGLLQATGDGIQDSTIPSVPGAGDGGTPGGPDDSTNPGGGTNADGGIVPIAAVAGTPVAVPAAQAIADEAAPLAEGLEDEEVPLAGFESDIDCWVHWLIMLGMLATAIYSLAVVIRRQKNSSALADIEQRVMGDAAAAASAATSSGAFLQPAAGAVQGV